jgi:hypothetical protein
MNITKVENAAELKSFIDLPYRFYKDDPVWVPPLRDEQRGQFDPVRNPLLEHCEYALFLLQENGVVTGRIAAFIDKLALEAWGEPVGCSAIMNLPRPWASPAAGYCAWMARPTRYESHAWSVELRLPGVGSSGGGLFSFTGRHGTLQPPLL